MSSSDSEDDCYGNTVQKLQKLRSTIPKEKVDRTVLNDSIVVRNTSSRDVDNSADIIVVEDLNTNSTDNDEFSLDAIIAKNSMGKPGRGRGSKRKATSDTGPTERETRSSRRRTKNSNGSRTSPVPEPSSASLESNIALVAQLSETLQEIATTAALRRRAGRGRRSRGRTRGRGGSRRELWAMFDGMFGVTLENSTPSNAYPTYSIGNTDEYPDQSDNQQLFSSRPVANNDVQVIEEDPLEDDNEEMSVKVYWQSLDVFKFKIRKYQKLTQIFEYFTEKEDGGITNRNITHLTQGRAQVEDRNGLKLKFQCQNKKKPFETTLKPNDKLVLAMIKYAEHLETPIDRLKFYFDGDLITSKSTPQDLELEGGECIDVKIISS